MYLHQVLQQEDASEFVKGVVKVVNTKIEQKTEALEMIEQSKVIEGMDPLPVFWAMRWKRNLISNAIIKYKARLNINGDKQKHSVNYFKPYAPVVA